MNDEDKSKEQLIDELNDLRDRFAALTGRGRHHMREREYESGNLDLMDNLPGIFLYRQNTDRIFTYISPSVTGVLGYTPQEFLTHFTEYLTDDPCNEEVEKHSALSMQGVQQPPYEVQIFHKDGSIRWLEVSEIPIFDANKNVIAVEGIAHDITIRKHAEESLRESEKRLITAGKAAYDLIYEWDVTNDALEWFGDIDGLLGYKKGAISRNINAWLGLIHPEDQVKLENAVEYHRTSKEPIQYEYRIRHKDGTYRHWNDHGLPLLDDKGCLYKWVGVCTDITERKAAEMALQEREREYATLLRNLPGMVYRCRNDRNWTMQFVSERCFAVTGYKPENLIDNHKLSYNDLILSEDQELLWKKWQELLPRHAYFEGEYRIKTADGEIKWVWERGRGIFDKNDQLLFLEGYVEDITERKQLGEMLRQSQKMEAVGTLAGGIAHDFNNILGVILGYAEMTLEDVPESSSANRYAREIRKAGVRARDLIKQILAFSRKHVQNDQPIKLQNIIKETVKMLRSTIPTTIEIKQTADEQCGTVLADPTQINQVLVNLCTNASHAMMVTGGVLEIGLTEVVLDEQQVSAYSDLKPGTYVKLSVSDTGTGIDSRIIDKIFEPFFTTKDVGKGTGMGLAVVYGIIKSHGGTITVESAPGKGTAFHILLLQAGRRQAAEEKEAEETLPRGSESILLVDDEDMLLEVGKKMLESLGYSVAAINSSPEAVTLFSKEPQKFNMVITDQTMPHMTGFDLAREIMSIRTDIPVILCTGYSETVSEDKAKAAGIKDFVLKPLERKDIAVKVRTVLDNQ